VLREGTENTVVESELIERRDAWLSYGNSCITMRLMGREEERRDGGHDTQKSSQTTVMKNIRTPSG